MKYLENQVETSKECRNEMIYKWRKIYFEENETMIALLESEEAKELNQTEIEELLRWSGDNEYAFANENGELVYMNEDNLEN